jgi:tetratricopeptide (TPR) repeat protein
VAEAIQYERESQQLCHEAGNLYDESHALMNIWIMYQNLGMWEQQAGLLREGIEAMIPNIHIFGQLIYYAFRTYGCLRESRPVEALEYARKGLQICPERPEHVNWAAVMKAIEGDVLAALSRDEEAQASLFAALEMQDGAPDVLRIIALEILVRFHTSRGTLPTTVPYLEQLCQSNWAEHDFWRGYNTNAAMLTCYRAFRQLSDPRAQGLLEHAYQAVETFSVTITDPQLRRSYRENLSWNREILQEWAAVIGE